jgi:hypothetical protein
MATEQTYDYAIVRLVPRVERGECINVGVILACTDSDFLDCRIVLDRARVLSLDPAIDLEEIQRVLATLSTVCAGGPGSGPIGELSWRERFRWLASPRSTVVQMSAVHTGRTTNPAATLEKLTDRLVRISA